MAKSTPKSSPAKRKAKDSTPNTRSSKRRAASSKDFFAATESTTALSEEDSFRRRNAAEFGEGPIKVEEADSNTSCAPLDVAVSGGPPSPVVRLSAPCEVEDARRTDAIHGSASEHDDREDVLNAILMKNFNEDLTRYAVNQLLQDARGSAGQTTDFGITHVEALVGRLKRKGIPQSRLAELLDLLKEGLRRPVAEFFSRVDSLGTMLLPPSPVVSEPALVAVRTRSATPRQELGDRSKIGPSKTLYVEVAPTSKDVLAKFEVAHSPSESSASSSDDEDHQILGSHRGSKYQDDDDEEYQDDNDRTGNLSDHTEGESGTTLLPLSNMALHTLTYAFS